MRALRPRFHAAATSVKTLRDTLRREIAPEPHEAALSLAKARLSGGNLDEGMQTMPIAALLLGFVYAAWHPLWLVGLWLAAFTIVWALHWSVNQRLTDATPATARPALRYYRFQNVLFIGVWASQAWLFWAPGDPVNHMVISAVILASTIGAVMSSAWAPTAATQIVAYIGSAAILFAMDGSSVGVTMVCLSMIFGVFVVGTSAHMHQTTERMLRLEADKDRLIDSLRASDRAKSDFLANMSHELRTPLNAILGFSEVMKDEVLGVMGNASYRSYAGDIHSSGQHLLGLINDILDLSKIEAGKTELNDDVFTLDEIVDMAFQIMRTHAEKAGVALVKDVPGDTAVRWDLRAAKQIAINLMSNAIKFTPAGGSITVSGRRLSDGGLSVAVTDTGSGIHPRDHRKIFEPFGQGRHDVATARSENRATRVRCRQKVRAV